MAYAYKLIILNRRTGAPTLEQDVSHPYHDFQASTPPETAADVAGTGTLMLTQLQRENFVIDNFFECWEGWRDVDTDEWDDTRKLYSYWIMVPEGSRDGAIHNIAAETVSNDVLLDTTPVLTWPTSLEDAETPAGHSVLEWLVGTTGGGAPYTGVLPFHFPDGKVDFQVEAVWDTILFDDAHMPSKQMVATAAEYGMFGFCGLRDLLDEIARLANAAAKDAGTELHAAYFARTVRHPADATKLCPQICFVDLKQDAGTETPVAYYSIDHDIPMGIYPVEHPLIHRRDGHSAQTEVIVMADGDHADGFVWSAKHSTTGAATYPAYYHRRPYWGGPPVLDPNITTQADCDTLAQRIADLKWGARGTLLWDTYWPQNLRPGDLVELHYPSEGQDHHKLRVIGIARAADGRMTLTAGEREIAIADIQLPRSQTPMIISSGQGGAGNAAGPAAGQYASGNTSNGTPRQRPLVNVPVHGNQNITQPQFQDVTAQTWQAVSAVRPSLLEDPPPAKPLTAYQDPAGNVRNWASGVDGTDHPHHYTFPVAADGTVPFVIPDPAVLVTEKILNLDGSDASGTVTTAYLQNAGSVSNPTVGTPLVVARYDVLQVAFTGITTPIAFLLSEAPPL